MAFKPKPFKRPGVEIGNHTGRVWLSVPAERLEEGDIVVDLGAVVHVDLDLFHVNCLFFSGAVRAFGHTESVRAFSKPVS